ncbi:hypothetical protein ACIBCN_18670 [Nocardia sp. NPDC051052]|uniref:hypothetical protein n=1 Tax=Nocardia sp. NPDC051052 TaxID=3364322 RepID=UPI0037A430F3
MTTENTPQEYLDDSQRAQLMTQLAQTPDLLGELDTTLARDHRFTLPGQTGRPAGSTQPLPYRVDASDAIDALHVVLRVYSYRIANRTGDGWPPEDTAGQARWLRQRLPFVAGTEPVLSGLAHAVTAAYYRAMDVIDRPPERWHLGACAACGNDIDCTAGEQIAECVHCGDQVNVPARRAEMLRRAAKLFGDAEEWARLLPWVGGFSVTADALTKAGQRGKLPRYTIDGRIVYQLGDILDWNAARLARLTGVYLNG